ncbi:MAG: methionine gamma-lyase family protein [Tenericutes bacterium]|nr:methionine gamma-lyase family protein [Mycoplasmatota bacterium]
MLKLNDKYIKLVNEEEKKLSDIFNEIDINTFNNSKKVLDAFHKNNISESDLNGTTGYGYNDIGRDKIENIFAEILNTEDALVRTQIISGSHAISTALFAILRPNDTLLTITGTPYDTLHEVIGIKPNNSSLMSYNIKYKEIDLKNNDFDYDKIKEELKNNIKVIHIQRSRGYSLRDSLTVDKVNKVIKFIKDINSNIIIFVDNCYCEFVENENPTADLIAGSLIKNLGGGIARNGGYIAGKKELIELCAERLNVPGEAKEVGPSGNANREFLQGLYFAPSVVSSALKTAILTSKVLETLNYKVSPKYNEQRADIVELIYFNNKNEMIKYSEGIQHSGAIDANVDPIPSPMPGYADEIIMASSSFIQGSSIEISCDGPLRDPFVIYQQGTLTYDYGKIALINAISKLNE